MTGPLKYSEENTKPSGGVWMSRAFAQSLDLHSHHNHRALPALAGLGYSTFRCAWVTTWGVAGWNGHAACCHILDLPSSCPSGKAEGLGWGFRAQPYLQGIGLEKRIMMV